MTQDVEEWSRAIPMESDVFGSLEGIEKPIQN